MNNTDIYSQIRSNFLNNYEIRVAPFLKVFEEKRKKQFIKRFLSTAFIAAIIICFFVTVRIVLQIMGDMEQISLSNFFVMFQELNIEEHFDISCLGVLVCWVVIIPFFVSILCYEDGIENQFKKNVMPCICECFENINLKWRSGANMTQSEVRTVVGMLINCSELGSLKNIKKTYTAGKRYMFHLCWISRSFWYNTIIRCDDIFHGVYGGVEFDIHEIKILKDYGSTRYQSYVKTIFKGLVIKLDMNKSFRGNTVIVPSGTVVRGLWKINLKDVQFGKFDVYTNDKIGARDFITRVFMKRFKDIGDALNCFKQSCSFCQNSLILELERERDFFSLGSLFKKPDYRKQCLIMLDIILFIIKLIDHFKADTEL